MKLTPGERDAVAAVMHARWVNGKKAKGITSRKSEPSEHFPDGEEYMVPFHELSEPAKDLDRQSVDAALVAFEACGYEIAPAK